jgi:hypothetical protein
MRVLLIHHGRLPESGQPVTGGARRAAVHAHALRSAGHQVRTLAREQDGRPEDPHPGFRSPGDLRRLAEMFEPDWILCVAPEEAPALAPVAPLVVDLYAPRLLEGAFQGLQEEEAGRALVAVDAADEVLFSNPRQRWLWMGILGISGWDLASDVGLLVPLAALPGPARTPPERPRFVVGGRPWPWSDATDTVIRAARHLGGRGEVVTVGLPALPGVRALPELPLDGWQALLATSTAALDRYAPNPERRLALSFRQMDYLGAGLPLVSDPDTPLSEALRAARAGWVDEPLEEAIEAAISEPRSSASLAVRYAPEHTEAPLLAWAPHRRARAWNVARPGARLAAAEAVAAAARTAQACAEAELQQKRADTEALHAQLRALSASVEALSGAMHEVAGFRRETVQVLGTRLSGQAAEAEHLRRELEIARADLEKKNRELLALQDERDRLGRAFTFLRRNRG